MIKIFVFLIGLVVGSFLNCVIYRLEVGGNFLKGRSFCPYCKHILSFKDLIPVFNFLFLKGKCRYCHQKISWQYPLVELTTAILFVFTTYNLQPTTHNLQPLINLSYQLFVVCCLLVIFVYDLKHYIIPDKVIYPAILVSGIWYLVYGGIFDFIPKYEILNTIYAALGAAAFFLTVVLISHGKWMGVGDIKIAFFIGLFLSWPKILVALFLAFFIGAVIGIVLVILGKKKMKSEIPFGPFLVTGTFLALFFGEQIVNWYLNLFLI